MKKLSAKGSMTKKVNGPKIKKSKGTMKKSKAHVPSMTEPKKSN